MNLCQILKLWMGLIVSDPPTPFHPYQFLTEYQASKLLHSSRIYKLKLTLFKSPQVNTSSTSWSLFHLSSTWTSNITFIRHFYLWYFLQQSGANQVMNTHKSFFETWPAPRLPATAAGAYGFFHFGSSFFLKCIF